MLNNLYYLNTTIIVIHIIVKYCYLGKNNIIFSKFAKLNTYDIYRTMNTIRLYTSHQLNCFSFHHLSTEYNIIFFT